MKNVIIAALANSDINIEDANSTILGVKMAGLVNQYSQAMYWILAHDRDDNIFYITKVFLNLDNLDADFAGQVDWEGTFDEMTDKFKTL